MDCRTRSIPTASEGRDGRRQRAEQIARSFAGSTHPPNLPRLCLLREEPRPAPAFSSTREVMRTTPDHERLPRRSSVSQGKRVRVPTRWRSAHGVRTRAAPLRGGVAGRARRYRALMLGDGQTPQGDESAGHRARLHPLSMSAPRGVAVAGAAGEVMPSARVGCGNRSSSNCGLE